MQLSHWRTHLRNIVLEKDSNVVGLCIIICSKCYELIIIFYNLQDEIHERDRFSDFMLTILRYHDKTLFVR